MSLSGLSSFCYYIPIFFHRVYFPNIILRTLIMASTLCSSLASTMGKQATAIPLRISSAQSVASVQTCSSISTLCPQASLQVSRKLSLIGFGLVISLHLQEQIGNHASCSIL